MTSDDVQMTENGEKLKTHVQDVQRLCSLNIQIYGFFVIKAWLN